MSSAGVAFSNGTPSANLNAKGPSNPPIASLPIENAINPFWDDERKIENTHKLQTSSPSNFAQEAPATFAPSDRTRMAATPMSAFSAYPTGTESTSEPKNVGHSWSEQVGA